MMEKLKAPYTWFGGKSRIAHEVWARFGDPDAYIEPFFGSGAVLWARPNIGKREIVNDADAHLCNFWRAVKYDPDAVAYHFDGFHCENDMHARNMALRKTREDVSRKLEGDPEWYDPKLAGWWVYVVSMTLTNHAFESGPWKVVGGELLRQPDADGEGIPRGVPNSCRFGLHASKDPKATLYALRDRIKDLRICSGDWSRVVSSVYLRIGDKQAIFLDPPYSGDEHRGDMYATTDYSISASVREWAIANGDNPRYRIALCGYEGEHEMPEGWDCYAWKTTGGYGNQGESRGRDNASRERVWFSPHCINSRLF